MKIFSVFACLLLASIGASAQTNLQPNFSGPLGFTAPSFYDGSNPSGQISNISSVGDIIYDSKANQFFGRASQDNPNQWVALSQPVGVNPVVSGSAGNRIEFATLSTACAVSNNSSSWLTFNTSPGTGACNMTVTGFASVLSCLCTSNAGGANGCYITSSGTSSFQVQSISTSTGSGATGIVTVMCMGR